MNNQIIKEASVIAGVSEDTVRKVVSGMSTPLISEVTQKRILKIINDLSKGIKNTRRERRRDNYTHSIIGIVMPRVAHDFWFDIIKGITEVVSNTGFNVAVFNLGKNSGAFYEYLIDEKFAGVLSIGSILPERVMDLLESSHIPFLYADRNVDRASSIYIDNKKGGSLAAEYLLSKGVKNPAYIGHDENCLIQLERLNGFKETFFDKSDTVCLKEVFVPFMDDSVEEKTRELIENGVDGFFYFCDGMAYKGLNAIKESNRDIKIVGYDDLSASEYIGLTSIRQPAVSIGMESARSLLKMIDSGNHETVKKCFDPELRMREISSLFCKGNI